MKLHIIIDNWFHVFYLHLTVDENNIWPELYIDQ